MTTLLFTLVVQISVRSIKGIIESGTCDMSIGPGFGLYLVQSNPTSLVPTATSCKSDRFTINLNSPNPQVTGQGPPAIVPHSITVNRRNPSLKHKFQHLKLTFSLQVGLAICTSCKISTYTVNGIKLQKGIVNGFIECV